MPGIQRKNLCVPRIIEEQREGANPTTADTGIPMQAWVSWRRDSVQFKKNEWMPTGFRDPCKEVGEEYR